VVFLDDFKSVVDRLVMHTVGEIDCSFVDEGAANTRLSVHAAPIRDICLEPVHSSPA
jgi:hypothetical protein